MNLRFHRLVSLDHSLCPVLSLATGLVLTVTIASPAQAQLDIEIGQTTLSKCVEMCRNSVGSPRCNFVRFPVVRDGEEGSCRLLSEKPARHVSSFTVYSMIEGRALGAGDYGPAGGTPASGACVPGQKPNLARVFKSTGMSSSYGEIHFAEGWYGSKSKTIQVTSVTQKAGSILSASNANEWLVEGHWGRTSGSYRGYFAFYFPTNCEFSGWWWEEGDREPDVSSAKPNWAGELK